MKNTLKFFALAACLGLFIASCGKKADETATTPAEDTTKVETVAPVDTTGTDTTSTVAADTTAH